MPAKLLAVARRPDGLRDKHHVAHNIPTLKLYYLTHRGETIYRVLAWKLRGGPEVDSIHSVGIGQQR